MATVITVVNQKGGVGKSTTAQALVAGLNASGKKTLGVDLDAQGNLSYSMNAQKGGATSLGLLTGEVTAQQATQHTPQGDLIPSSPSLAGADAVITQTGKEYRLKEALEEAKGSYDYIIIDTPPALGILTVNALTASDKVIIPAQADIYSLQGIEQLTGTIQPIKKYCNPSLQIDGILLTRFNARTTLSKEVEAIAEQIAQNLNTRLYKTRIREATAVKEAQVKKQSIFDYAPKGKATEDYRSFIAEVVKG